MNEYIFIKIKRCQICYLRQHIPNMMEAIKQTEGLEEEIIQQYSLCYRPEVIMSEFIWILEEAQRNMNATPPEKAKFV